MESVECVIVGAGVVGLAIARELAQQGKEVLILEAEERYGLGNSSRNSEVIHAGIYYPANSLKARFCVQGKELLYDYCKTRNVPHQRCGKLIVASDESQRETLLKIAQSAAVNGVADLQLVERDELRKLEPELDCALALHSPSTGIIDSSALMLSLLGDAEHHGASLVCQSPVISGEITDGQFQLTVGQQQPFEIACKTLINSAGIGSQAIAHSLKGLDSKHIPPSFYAKGNYFSLQGKAPFQHLIYPVPEPGGLGTHLTLDLAGGARFGPDVEWLETLDYSVDPNRKEKFVAAIQRFWPTIDGEQLNADYAGIRPKITGPGETAADFMIQGPDDHGIRGLVNLFGIESPGLTSSLAIAQHVSTLVR